MVEVVDGGKKFKRPVYAGNAIATVSTSDKVKLLTVRTTNFERTQKGEIAGSVPTEEVLFDSKDI